MRHPLAQDLQRLDTPKGDLYIEAIRIKTSASCSRAVFVVVDDENPSVGTFDAHFPRGEAPNHGMKWQR